MVRTSRELHISIDTWPELPAHLEIGSLQLPGHASLMINFIKGQGNFNQLVLTLDGNLDGLELWVLLLVFGPLLGFFFNLSDGSFDDGEVVTPFVLRRLDYIDVLIHKVHD